MKKTLQLIQELLGYVYSRKITADMLDAFLAPFRPKSEKVASSKSIATISKKKISQASNQQKRVKTPQVTKFLKEVTLDLPERNLKEFFTSRKGFYFGETDFVTALEAIFAQQEIAPAETVTRCFYQIVTESHDDVIDKSVKDKIYDPTKKKDLAEMITRLNIAATMMEAQPNGKAGDLLTNGYANILFRIKVSEERVLAVGGYWSSGGQVWNGVGWFPYRWDAGGVRLSRNGGTQKP